MIDTKSIFDRYEEIRPRLPKAPPAPRTADITSLMDIVEEIDVFVFDAFGVLNVGETLIKGADQRLDALRAAGRRIRILTNAASYGRAGAIQKFRRLGLHVDPDEIISSRDAALLHLGDLHWGAITADIDAMEDIRAPVSRLGETLDAYDAVDGFLFLSTAGWSERRQTLLELSLRQNPRPVLIANADLAAPRDDGFSLEPGYFGHQLIDRLGANVRFFGKPFPDVYELVEATFPGAAPGRIAMCGDSLHTDILGAAARGWRTVLVTQDGLFAGFDTAQFSAESKIYSDWRLPRV